MVRDYYIAFNTKEAPGLIQATRVSVGTEFVRDPDKMFNIALCDDPLYPALVAYMQANPPKKAG